MFELFGLGLASHLEVENTQIETFLLHIWIDLIFLSLPEVQSAFGACFCMIYEVFFYVNLKTPRQPQMDPKIRTLGLNPVSW